MGKHSSSDEAFKHEPIRPAPIRVNRKPIKIKYICSPVTVKPRDAAEFRAMVQSLTGNSGASASASAGASGAMNISGFSTTSKEGKVQVSSHDTATPRPQSDLALDHDTMPSCIFEPQTCSETQTLESFVKFLSRK